MMKRGLLRLSGSGVLALLVLTHANAALAESLTDAMAAAYQTNPVLQGERAALRATDEEIPQALSGWRPKIEAEASYGYAHRNADSPLLNVQKSPRPLEANVTITQNVFAGFETVNATKRAEQIVEAGRNDLVSMEQATLLAAVRVYMDVIRDQGIVELNSSNKTVLGRQLESTRGRFNAGELTRMDTAQAQARLSGARTNLTQAQAQLTASRAAYERVVGRAPGTLERPQSPPNLPQSEEEARQIALKNNPDILAARHLEAASRSEIAVAESALSPRFDIEASYEYDRDSSIGIRRQRESSIKGVITFPLYQGGAEYSRIRQAKAESSRAMLRIAAVQRQVDESVRNAWELLRSAQASIISSEEQVRANRVALEGVREEAGVGSQTTLDVLNAEQELLNAQVVLVSAERDQAVAEYGLLAAMGQLTARQLELPVEYYDPAENTAHIRDKWVGFGSSDGN